MTDVAMMFREGGPFMYALLLFGLIGTPFAVIFALVVGATRARLPASIGWTLFTGASLVGLLGTWMGRSMALEAAASASPEMRQRIVASGIAVSMYTTTGWLLLVGLGLLLVAWSAWMPALLVPGPESRVDGSSAGAAIGGAILGALLGTGVVFVVLGPRGVFDAGPVWLFLPPLSFFTVLAMVLASLRASEEPEHRGRIAGTRAMLGTAAFLGIGLLGEAFVLMGETLAFQAVAMAAPDMKQKMLVVGLEIASYARWIGWGAALAPALAGWFGALPHVGQLGPRQGLGAAIAGIQVLVMLGTLVAATLLRDLATVLGG